MVSMFHARHYPAGREVNPDDQPVPNATPVSDANGPSSTSVNSSQPSDIPLADGVSASSDDPNPTPTTTDVLPTSTIVLYPGTTTPTNVPPQSSDVIPDPSQHPNDPPPTITPVQNPPPESTSVPNKGHTHKDQPPGSTPPPSSSPEKYSSTPVDEGSTPANSDPPHSSTQDGLGSSSPQPTQTDYFVPSSALNNPWPTTTQTLGTDTTPASSSTIDSTSSFSASSTVALSTGMLQPTPTAVLNQGGVLSTASSSNRKYIIGGAVGGGVFVLILLALLLFCCRKRRAKRDLERSGGGHSGEPGYGQFACCNHGICNRNNGQPQMEQKTPLKPFILKSDSVVLTPKEGQQRHTTSLERRNSTESHESIGSDSCSSYSCDSEGSLHGRRRSQKRPPPLKLTSLITPVINGPQNNPRHRVDRSSLPNLHEVPTIIVEPPQSATHIG